MATISPTAGSFTPTQLQKVIARVDSIWADTQLKQEYEANTGFLDAIRAEQTAKMSIIQNPDKDKILRVIWVADCSTVVEDCVTDEEDCNFTGPQAETRAQDYALDLCGKVVFSIEETQFYDNEMSKEEVLAVQFAKHLKELDENLVQKTIAHVNTFLGVNQYEGGIGQVDGVITYIPANYWTPDMYGYFGMVKIINKLTNPYLIHGSNLFQTNWQNTYNVANANQKDGLPKLESIRSYWDLFNVDTMNAPYQDSYMIAKGAVAFANKARYPLNNPRVFQFGKRWSIESKNLPGVFYDVIYKERCVGDQIWYDFKISYKAGVFLNPLGCNEDVTGVLKFRCGTAPAES